MIEDLINRLDRYLDRNSSLEEFETWLYGVAFDIEKRYSGRIVDLVHEVEAVLAEASSGNWSVTALDRQLNLTSAPYREHSRVVLFRDRHRSKRVRISSAPILLRKELV